jgi:hypothetical protein
MRLRVRRAGCFWFFAKQSISVVTLPKTVINSDTYQRLQRDATDLYYNGVAY